MKKAIHEMERRREKQMLHNKLNNITPAGIKKRIKDIIEKEADKEGFKLNREERKKYRKYEDLTEPEMIKEIGKLEKKMQAAAKNLEFENAANIRDEIKFLKTSVYGNLPKDSI